MDVGPQLTGRRALGRRRLQRVSPLHRVAAIVTPANVHVEAAVDHVSRNLGLILPREVGLAHVLAGAVWTLQRQRDFVDFVEVGWNAAMGMRPVASARLATRRLRLGQWFVLFPKRRCLPLAATAFFFQRRRELGDLLLKRFESTPHEAILLPQQRTFRTIFSWLLRIHDRGDYQPSPNRASSAR